MLRCYYMFILETDNIVLRQTVDESGYVLIRQEALWDVNMRYQIKKLL